jgi:hypothetical protein
MSLTLCYTFVGESPASYYDVTVNSRAVVHASVGSVVVGVSKSVVISGFGVGPSDRTKWVLVNDTCAPTGDFTPFGGVQAFSPVVASSLPGRSLYGDGANGLTSGNISVLLSSPGLHVLCYAFGAGNYFGTNITLNVLGIMDASVVAVAQRPTAVVIGNSRIGDKFKFVPFDATNCLSSGLAVGTELNAVAYPSGLFVMYVCFCN